MKILLILISSFIFLSAKDGLLLKQKNALYVQNLIKLEEDIAKSYEKYILTEFSIPTLEKLINNNYLGSNFSVKNAMGNNIAFKDALNLQIKYAVTKSFESYVKSLYNRNLYRDRTSVYEDIDDINNSYIEILLQSDEAKNIFEILNSLALDEGFVKECRDDLKKMFCNNNFRTIRWYDSVSDWIEFDKKDLYKGNVTVKNSSMLNDPKIDKLSVGSYIYIENSSKYIKLIDNRIMKVD